LADPLLLKVIYNLMENAIRHGQTVTRISSYWEKKSDGCVDWIIEDDGIGIPLSLKKSIFSREVGKNTGLGLFLAREILAITGITIQEVGGEGEGARFLMN
jgi:signal transduction histidine kinase